MTDPRVEDAVTENTTTVPTPEENTVPVVPAHLLHDLDHVARLREIAKAARQAVLDLRSMPYTDWRTPPHQQPDAIAMRMIGLYCRSWWDDESYKPRNFYHVLRIAYIARALTRELRPPSAALPAARVVRYLGES